MVPIVNKSSFSTKYFFFFIYDSFCEIITQQNLETFGITIQMFGRNDGLDHSIAFNGDQIVSLIMGDRCIVQPRLA
jgi:hypothetical protein